MCWLVSDFEGQFWIKLAMCKTPSPSQVIIHEKSFSHIYFCVKHKIILAKTLMDRNPWTFSYWFGGSCYYSHLQHFFKIVLYWCLDLIRHNIGAKLKLNKYIFDISIPFCHHLYLSATLKQVLYENLTF
jgi:hypothetical protein